MLSVFDAEVRAVTGSILFEVLLGTVSKLSCFGERRPRPILIYFLALLWFFVLSGSCETLIFSSNSALSAFNWSSISFLI
jgi:hypothetical protein